MLLFTVLTGGREVASASDASRQLDPPAVSHPIVGERLGFHGHWIGIPVGYGWIEVKERVELGGRPAYHIHAEGHTNEVLSAFYPIHDIVDSYLDAETLQPLRFEKHQREGHYQADEEVTFDGATHVATYHSLLNGSIKQIPFPSGVQDIISALYWFRAQPLRQSQPLSLEIYTDEKIFHTSILVNELATLELLKRGTFSCFMIEPKASFKGLLISRGRLWAYVTNDAYRLPLLIKVTTPWGPMSAVIDEASLPPSLAARFRH